MLLSTSLTKHVNTLVFRKISTPSAVCFQSILWICDEFVRFSAVSLSVPGHDYGGCLLLKMVGSPKRGQESEALQQRNKKYVHSN